MAGKQKEKALSTKVRTGFHLCENGAFCTYLPHKSTRYIIHSFRNAFFRSLGDAANLLI